MSYEKYVKQALHAKFLPDRRKQKNLDPQNTFLLLRINCLQFRNFTLRQNIQLNIETTGKCSAPRVYSGRIGTALCARVFPAQVGAHVYYYNYHHGISCYNILSDSKHGLYNWLEMQPNYSFLQGLHHIYAFLNKQKKFEWFLS